jgi:post-segregation antitoxin (ccd killing protein)
MKSFFLLLFALATFSSFKATAQDINIAAAVTTSFHASFKNATDVAWSQTGSHYKATFHLNGQYATAFYDQHGTLLGVTRNISAVQLPVTLQASLKASYEDCWISDLFELSDNNGTAYYVTLENNDSKITLKSILGQWSVYKKNRKS